MGTLKKKSTIYRVRKYCRPCLLSNTLSIKNLLMFENKKVVNPFFITPNSNNICSPLQISWLFINIASKEKLTIRIQPTFPLSTLKLNAWKLSSSSLSSNTFLWLMRTSFFIWRLRKLVWICIPWQRILWKEEFT